MPVIMTQNAMKSKENYYEVMVDAPLKSVSLPIEEHGSRLVAAIRSGTKLWLRSNAAPQLNRR